jgi:hypothetical protein
MFLGLPYTTSKKDHQQSKVYSCERRLEEYCNFRVYSLSTLQTFCNDTCKVLRDKLKIPLKRILVLSQEFKDYSECFRDEIRLIPKHQNKFTVLHELAHIILIDTKHWKKHDAVFCSLLLWLLSSFVSVSVANQMVALYLERGVKFIPCC